MTCKKKNWTQKKNVLSGKYIKYNNNLMIIKANLEFGNYYAQKKYIMKVNQNFLSPSCYLGGKEIVIYVYLY